MKTLSRILCIVLDGVGAGAAPDAQEYGDAGANTIGNTARAVGGLRLPQLGRLGLGNILDVSGVPPRPDAAADWGVMVPAATGKDSTTGHWELMGCILDSPLPLYPDGFPEEVLGPIEAAVGCAMIGNRMASGTVIIDELGPRHLATGQPIVYTSQDSVFQIAAHEEVIPVERLYEICQAARDRLVPPHGVGRVIARPFLGHPGAFQRTPRRRDFSIPPPGVTVLDLLLRAGRRVRTIGKIDDLFAGRGISRAEHTRDNRQGMRLTLAALAEGDAEFVFVNLVDFDTMWGHRNDARAWALGLEEFDSFLLELLPALGDGDLLIITSDHGNDPTQASTDHSRETVPVLLYRHDSSPGYPLGVRKTLADVGATVALVLGAQAPPAGTTLLDSV